MKAPWKKILLALFCLLLVSLGSLGFAPVQTWLARQVLARQPDFRADLERVQLGWGGVDAQGLRAEYAGAVLTLPAIEADVAILAAIWREQLTVKRLTARGWTLDLTHYAPARAAALGLPRGADFSLLNSAYAQSSATAEVKTIFQGVFAQLRLPFDLALDNTVLEGTVILPGQMETAPLAIKLGVLGGGLRAGAESNFTLSARIDFTEAEAPVSLLDVGGNLRAVMDSPRTFAKLALNLNAQASGAAFPQGVQLSAELTAARVSGGESYALTLQSVGKRLLDAQLNFPDRSPRLAGVWRLDMRDTDVAPFVLGRRLPSFEAVGAGMFETDAAFGEIHAAGRIKSTLHRLEMVVPGWTDLAALTVFGEFDLTQLGTSTRVDKLEIEVARPDPVLAIRALQAFEFDPASGSLKVANPQGELWAIDARGVPLAWLQPWLDDIELRGDGLHGQLVAAAHAGGMTLRTTAPLRIDNLHVEQARRPLLESVNLSTGLTADYNPQGWQGVLDNFALSSRGQNIMAGELRAGGMQHDSQPIKATGRLSVNLVALSQQPPLADTIALTGGTLAMDFSASLGTTQELQADLRSQGLAAAEVALPALETTLRASRDAAGKITFNLPLILTTAKPQRASDLKFTGSLQLANEGGRIAAHLGGKQVYVEDLQLFAAALVATADAGATTSKAPESAPFWQGWTGEIALQLQSLFYTPQFELREVSGTMRLEAGALQLDDIKAATGTTGALNLRGAVNFDARKPQPYDLQAEVKVHDFDSGPFFRALDPTRAPQIEGLFSLDSKISGQGRNPADLLDHTRGGIQLTSTGGVFRLLSTDVSAKVEQVGKLAAVGAFIGNVASAFGKGNKDVASFASKAQAVNQFAGQLTAIAYDQLTVSLARDDGLNTMLHDFSLISPELRLVGTGGLNASAGQALLEQPLKLDLQLKARGRAGDALRYLNVLTPETDTLGYAACTLPLKINGTLLHPDTAELQSALLNLAVEQSGAGDLLNRLLGK